MDPSPALRPAALGLACTALLPACRESSLPDPAVPDTYDFQPASWSGQLTRLAMLEELAAYAKSAGDGTALDDGFLTDLYANENDPFGDPALNESGKRLRDKTFELDVAFFDGLLQDLAAASQSGVPASPGQAGVLTSGSRSYLVDEHGFEPAQLLEKGLMGAVLYYQAVGVYLTQERMDVDNEIADPVEGTAMAHHWDEAFGYLAAPVDFASGWPGTREDELSFWSKYGNDRDPLLGTNDRLMEAFRAGRAAISAGRLDLRDERIAEVRAVWEEIVAATAVHYLNEALSDLADDALRCHRLSEAWAFVRALKYNPERTISTDGIEEVLGLIGDDLYAVSAADLQAARDLLVDTYGLEEVAGAL